MINIKVLASSSKGNCYMIDDSRTSLLIEAGIPIKKIKQAMNFKLTDTVGCLVSHSHFDHSKDIKKILSAGINVYTSKGTSEELKVSDYNLHHIESGKQFKIRGWTILPFETFHNTKEPLGFLITNKNNEKLLFATDTYYLKYKFKGLNIIMIECNHSYKILDDNVAAGRLHPAQKKRLIQSHMALENVKDMLKANDLSKVKEIYLIHLSDRNSSAKEFKKEIQSLTGKPVYVSQE